MNIYLFLPERMLTFHLPKDISGSFSFDPNPDEESKLINIEAKDSKWVLYSTNDTSIVSSNTNNKVVELQADTYYLLKKNDKTYLIYAEDTSLNKVNLYKYDDKLNLVIGNTNNCNISYNFGINKSIENKIYLNNNQLILENISDTVYVNGKSIKEKQIAISIGDQINIYNLKIIILKNLVLINSISTKLKIIENNITKYSFPDDTPPENIDIKDIDLYNSNQYFSKAPRLRRNIEEKVIKLDNPPSESNNNEMPLILTIGPMITMGATSAITLISTVSEISSGRTTVKEQWASLLTCALMLASMLLWPLITQAYNNRMKEKRKKELIEKYSNYLDNKRTELEKEVKLQKDILLENLITTQECINIIKQRNANFWSKRVDQSDFLVTRIGFGNEKLAAKIEYPEKGFTIEESTLEKNADKLVEDFKYINDVPVSYSFHDNKITAIMGQEDKSTNFINNILLQLLTFYTYEDIKIVIITNDNNKNNWEYIRYLNHNFNNEKTFRFFASDPESIKTVLDYLTIEINNRKGIRRNETIPPRPYYLVIIDDYSKVKRHDFIKSLTEDEDNDEKVDLGFSLIIKENMLKNLPSKCNNFVILSENNSSVMKNSYEDQEQIIFKAEYIPTIDLMNIPKILSNIPIEFEEGMSNIPDSISFLEMEKVGKVEQLNILNRWHTNDSTESLKAEIGLDSQQNLIYLDLHEKYHGPHGLIAGTTGSGKSEFIITYVLSMCINYSPDDISFILIDYKGGGLALAFENKTNGIVLPHLAGTITNLDKAEMDRTLVSIKSEAERRQKIFNDAKDKLGESTMDIYKYQKHFHDGRLDEPVSHLFIICDEFAELKSQQPEFMDDLISIARIGRSLGVHLILATQKPSGVVNDQIWSNTRFRVCLKVQDEADSKEMLKKPDAAHISQTGRFYLQVGYDEVYTLGQSGWCGAKYFPSNKIVKQVDKSINFLNENGSFIKSIQASSGQVKQAQGEQLANILKNIIEVSDMTNKKARKLWLDNIPEVILEDAIEQKYNVNSVPYNVEAIIGEYDAPENQEQGIIKYNFINQGNTVIYGNDGSEKEFLLNTILYSSTKNHSAEEINYYIIDYGSQSLRKYNKLPHIGGIVYEGEEDKYNNLFKLIKEELANRKKIFADFGGEYKNYLKESNNKIPIIAIILNNYDSIYESNQDIYDELPDLLRDSERYGIVFILTVNATNSIPSKISQSISNIYSFKLKDSSDYNAIFDSRTKIVPRDTFGRGLLKINNIYEFQTASITEEEKLNDYIKDFINIQINKNQSKAKRIPTVPNIIRYKDVESEIYNIRHIPIGMSKNTLEVVNINFTTNLGNLITSNKLANTYTFVESILQELKLIKDLSLIVIDTTKSLNLNPNSFPNYYTDNFENVIDSLNEFIERLIAEKKVQEGIILIYGISKMITKIEDMSKFEKLIQNIKKYEKISLIVVEDVNKLKQYTFDTWFTEIISINDGIWIGRGVSDQSLIHLSTVSKEMLKDYKNDMGYYISENFGTLVKFIDFITPEEKVDNNE